MDRENPEKDQAAEGKSVKRESDEVANLVMIEIDTNEASAEAEADCEETSTTQSTAGLGNKRGRLASDVWNLFTSDKDPQCIKSAQCLHCKQTVSHHKKSEYAKRHLLNCANFKRFMMGQDPNDRPDWFPSSKKQAVEVSKSLSSKQD